MHFSLSNGYPCSHTHFQFYTNCLKGKKPTPKYCIRGDTPWRILYRGNILFSTAEVKKKKNSEPMILVPFQDISPFKTTQAKIFTKVRHSQTTLRGKKKITRKIHERDWRLHHNKVSAIILSMKMSFRIGKVKHAANISFGLEKSKSFHFLF